MILARWPTSIHTHTQKHTHKQLCYHKTHFYVLKKRFKFKEHGIPRPSCKHTLGWIQTRTASIHCNQVVTTEETDTGAMGQWLQFDMTVTKLVTEISFSLFQKVSFDLTIQKKPRACMCKPCVHDLLNHKRFTTVPLYLKKGRKKKASPCASQHSQSFELRHCCGANSYFMEA